MEFQRLLNGKVIDLDSATLIGKGGEANIYILPGEVGLAAKIYHELTEERAAKLFLMQANPPDDPSLAMGHSSLAWPIDLLHKPGKQTQIIGFLMPRIQGMRPISDYYNPVRRCQHCPLFNYKYLLQAARNITMTIAALHRRNYLIGDLNDGNILVGSNALISFVDNDSFQVQDPKTGHIYRCVVGTTDFTPPELQGRNLEHRDRVAAHDLFGLAVLLFETLMEGIHPFDGIYQGKGGTPSRAERIASGYFPYGNHPVPFSIRPDSPPFEMLHPELQSLFVRAFEVGDSNPVARPTATEWQSALEIASNALVVCAENDQHFYGSHLKNCPWCERTVQLRGADPFPSIDSVRAGEHLQVPSGIQHSLPPAHKEIGTFSPVGSNSYASAPIPFSMEDSFQEAQPKSLWPWVAATVGMIGLAGAATWMLLPKSPTEAERKVSINQRVLAPSDAETPGQSSINPKDAATLVWVPAGVFTMGSSEGEIRQLVSGSVTWKWEKLEPEKPQHRVSLDGYFLYKSLVTVKQYLRFCTESGHIAPQAPDDNSGWKKQNLPIVNVSWSDAKAYCVWAGAALPTEAQWEKGARGTDLRQFPWGNEWDDKKCRNSKKQYGDSGGASATDKHASGASPYGALDMAGNVWQWCADWYSPDYYKSSVAHEPLGPSTGSAHVMRGGSWCDTEPYRFRSAFRFGANDTNLYTPIGFRCVVIPKIPSSLALGAGG